MPRGDGAAASATLGARLVGARRDAARRHRGDARALDRVRAADAGARLGAERARDRPGRARQALPADRDRRAVAALPRLRAIPGVQAAAPRYEVQAADSFALGETIDVIAYPGDHTVFEAPPLVAGRAAARPGRGRGRAAAWREALGLSPGSTLAIALSSGRELRLRVAGVVSSLDHDGRVAYVPAAALLRADPSAPFAIAVGCRPAPTWPASSAR